MGLSRALSFADISHENTAGKFSKAQVISINRSIAVIHVCPFFLTSESPIPTAYKTTARGTDRYNKTSRGLKTTWKIIRAASHRSGTANAFRFAKEARRQNASPPK